ncbi:MAG: hypothetical protein ACD_55C00021G0001 [uncultured bacterium]|nr:MAG: hypothetical protein ACD_55C00021G0001 [uncultured bacterium]
MIEKEAVEVCFLLECLFHQLTIRDVRDDRNASRPAAVGHVMGGDEDGEDGAVLAAMMPFPDIGVAAEPGGNLGDLRFLLLGIKVDELQRQRLFVAVAVADGEGVVDRQHL